MWDENCFIIIKRGKIEKFWRGHHDILIRMPEKLEGSNGVFGVDLALCPKFCSNPDVVSSLSARGTAGVDVYPISKELATEICKVCYSEFSH